MSDEPYWIVVCDVYMSSPFSDAESAEEWKVHQDSFNHCNLEHHVVKVEAKT